MLETSWLINFHSSSPILTFRLLKLNRMFCNETPLGILKRNNSSLACSFGNADGYVDFDSSCVAGGAYLYDERSGDGVGVGGLEEITGEETGDRDRDIEEDDM